MLCFAPTYTHWLDYHQTELNRYLYECVEEHSRDHVKAEFYQDPYLGMTVVQDFLQNNTDTRVNVDRLLQYILEPGVFVILVLGMPDSGKTTSALAICEKLRNTFKIVTIAPIVDEGSLPDWIQWKSSPYLLESGELAIVDESSIQNNARRASSAANVDDLGWLAVGRHVGAKMIYISQMSSIADINLTRWANVIISKGYDTSAVGSTQIERNFIADNPILQYLSPVHNYAGVKSTKKDWGVVTAGGSTYMVYLQKPYFMNDKLSRSYMRYIERAGGDEKLAEKLAIHDAFVMRDNGHNAQTIYTQMMARGFRRSKEFWKKFTGEIKTKDDEEFD